MAIIERAAAVNEEIVILTEEAAATGDINNLQWVEVTTTNGRAEAAVNLPPSVNILFPSL